MYAKTNRKWISILLCFAMLLTMLPTLTVAAENSLTDVQVMHVDNGSSTIDLNTEQFVYVRDLWAAADTEDGLVFDYTVSMTTADILQAHNEMVEENQKIGTNYYNDGKLFLEAMIQLETDEGWVYLPTASAMYSIFEYDLRGDANRYYDYWGGSNTAVDFITITATDAGVKVQVNATMQELEAYAGMPVNQMSLYIGVEGKSYTLWYGYYLETSHTQIVDSVGIHLYDAHMRQSEVEVSSMLTLDQTLTVNDLPYEEEMAGFYEPVSRRYVWHYTFSRMSWGYDENDNWSCIGGCFDELEGDGIATEVHDGVVYGGVRGTYDAGSDASVSIREMLCPEELAFVETLKGVDPTGYGGEVWIELVYTLYLTFADGSVKVLEDGMMGNETLAIAGICLHTCTVCGMCTSEDLLACNSRYGWRTNECTCKVSSPAIESSSVEDATVVESNAWCGDVTARVETFDVEVAVTTDYFKAIINSVGSSKVAAVYDITLYNELCEAYTINEWGGTEEYVTLTSPVSAEIAQAAANGELELYHVNENGVAELVGILADTVNNTITFTGYSFSPYVLLEVVPRYGRTALSKLDNAAALLYAYDRIVAGVDLAAEEIDIYDGQHTISMAELNVVLEAYRNDYAEHFWLGNAWSISYNSDTCLALLPQYLMQGSTLKAAKAAFEEALEEMLSCVNDSMSEFEIAVALHDAVAAHVTYAEGENAHNAYGALINGICVCEGYAELYQVLLQKCGIQSFLVTGQSYNPGTGSYEGHEWNIVRIDGEYYHVDVTWDDQGETIYHAYFGLTDALIQEDHILDVTGYALPACTATAAQYHNVMGGRLETYTVDAVAQHLKNNGMAAFFYIPGDLNVFWAWFSSNFGQIAGQSGLSGSITSSASWLGHEMYIKLEKVVNIVAEGSCGVNLTWKLDEEGTLTISGTGAMREYDEYTSAPWFKKYGTKIYKIVIGEGVTSIGSYAFYKCNNVTDVTIPSTVKKIGAHAFHQEYRNEHLKNVYITDLAAWCGIDFDANYGNPMQRLAENFYVNGEAVIDLVIPAGVTKVANYAFVHGPFRSVVFPDGLTTIGNSAFWQCNNLRYIVLPTSVTTIGSDAFGEIGSTGLWHTLYRGTEQQWTQIATNSNLFGTKHFEANGNEIIDSTNKVCKLCCEHDWQFTEEIQAPNCTENGVHAYNCLLCGGDKTEEIPAAGHTAQAMHTVAPTCTEDGYTQYQCSVCFEQWNADPVTATGHDWIEPTCTEDGYCNVCGAAGESALGHNYEAVVTAPGCTEGGYTTYTCQCGDSYVADATPATGHAYESVVTKPTCSNGGYTTHTCANCGDSYVDSYTDPLPYTPGDSDGDGKVNTDDAIYLLYNVMFGDGDYPVNQNCDFDGNGETNTDDAIYLLYHVMFGETDYPLHN